ncbi:MAG: glycoside hydrolase [Lentisphaeria bacterium]|jgi:hypothetical protein
MKLQKHQSVLELVPESGELLLSSGAAVFPLAGGHGRVENVRAGEAVLEYDIAGLPIPLHARWEILREGDFSLTLSGRGRFEGAIEYPGNVESRLGDVLLLPIGEGFAFPVDDPAVQVRPECCPLWTSNRSMGFSGRLRQNSWLVAAVDFAADAQLRNPRNAAGLLESHLELLPSRGEWAYDRKLRFLVGAGGIAEACAAYRRYREELGQVKTLREKGETIPHLDKLAGAPDFWVWNDNYEKLMYAAEIADIDAGNAAGIARVARELHSHGCENALFGIFFAQDRAAAAEIIRETGYLVTKYDNLEDVLPASLAPLIPEPRIRQCDYTVRLMQKNKDSNDIILYQADGKPAQTWALRGTDGNMHNQYRMCSSFAPDFTRDTILPLAKGEGFNAWFFDVTGCRSHECFAPEHPQDRRSCIASRREAYDELNRAGLVTGTEEGVECYLDCHCYSEGRMSPASYRINPAESGRRKAHLYSVEERGPLFDGFMLNPTYRVPLWELVYHDCSVSYWYWGDSSNCCVELMDRRDLFNILYGTPPLYSFHNADWPMLKPKILRSIERACPVAKQTMYEKMTSFEVLTPDRQVQRTRFSDGTVVTVNFSEKQFRDKDGTILEASGYRIEKA